jgi:hypothetical protein
MYWLIQLEWRHEDVPFKYSGEVEGAMIMLQGASKVTAWCIASMSVL